MSPNSWRSSPVFFSNARMKSSPIIFLLASGSETPSSLDMNSSCALTTWKFLKPRWSMKSFSTSSASFLRIRPWSTNTQWSLSPIASCIKAAATDESTPPDSPMMTFSQPTSFFNPETAFSMKSPITQSGLHPQISKTKFLSIFSPHGVCLTSGWNCTPKMFSPSYAATGQESVEATALHPFGGFTTWSPWLIQTVSVFPIPFSNLPAPATASSFFPYSFVLLFSTLPPKTCASTWWP